MQEYSTKQSPDCESRPLPDFSLGGFDLESLRLSQDFGVEAGVESKVLAIPVRKPAKEWFVRVHPEYQITTCVLELKEEQEIYLVKRDLWDKLKSEPTFAPRYLVTAINRQGTLFVWPARTFDSDGRIDNWGRTMLEAISLAKEKWVRVTSNKSLGAYDVCVAPHQVGDPNWPNLTFEEILQIAFRNRTIADPAHPVLKRLRGEV